MKGKIIQIVSELHYGDAVGNDVLNLDKALVNMGYQTCIAALSAHPCLAGKVADVINLLQQDDIDGVILYHMTTGWDLIYRLDRIKAAGKILIYHNMTPPDFFQEYDDRLCLMLQEGREQLKALSNTFDLALGDSEYNRQELAANGYGNTGVLPIMLDFAEYSREPDDGILGKYRDGRTNIVFVGRVVPNKKHEDIIQTFHYYKNLFDTEARLFLIGSWQGMEGYYDDLLSLIKIQGVQDVYFTGHIDFAELLAYYQIAHLFLCMSEHEGFCVPLLESMYFQIPVLAYKSSAIPYTLGNSGVMFVKKDCRQVAEMMSLLVNDGDFRRQIIMSQNERLKAFEQATVENLLKTYLDQLLTK